MGARRAKRRLMGEINVVPYIDVMLVLLIIFMITAPLLAAGVKVELPSADAEPLEPNPDLPPVVITVNSAGEYFLTIRGENQGPLEAAIFSARLEAQIESYPGTQVVVRGDENVEYRHVISAMVHAQAAGAKSVGLMTEPPDRPLVERRDR